MNRLTRWDETNKCYRIRYDAPQGRSIIQELGVYEDIHEMDINKATNIGDIRDTYIKRGIKLDPYWENFGKGETSQMNRGGGEDE